MRAKSPAKEPTVEELDKFLSSTAWKYIRSELNHRLELTMDDLEHAPLQTMTSSNGDGKITVINGVQHLQGAVQELRFLLRYVDEIKSDLIDIEKQKQLEGDE